MPSLPVEVPAPLGILPGETTLEALRQAVRRRADMVNNNFITDDELTEYINGSYAELYDLLVQKYGDNYFVQNPATITTDGTSDQYALPDDFFKLLGVDLQLGGTADSFVTIRPFNFADRNRYSVPNFQTFYGVTNLRYRINGGQIWFTPRPAAGQNMRLWYIPRFSALVNNEDIVDGVSGWEEYIVVDAAIKCLAKEESDASIYMAQKGALIQRIEAAAENRDAGSPATVVDSQWSEFWWPNGTSGVGGAF